MLAYTLKAKSYDTLKLLRSELESREVQVSRMAETSNCDYNDWTIEQVEFWLTLQSHKYNPTHVTGFSAWVGHGCEPMVFGLAETPSGLVYEGFCETYGDKTPSLEVFEHRHCQACSMLEEAQGVGFEVDVVDHSGYWHTKDLKGLRKAAMDSNELAALLERAAIHTPILKIARALVGSQCVSRPI